MKTTDVNKNYVKDMTIVYGGESVNPEWALLYNGTLLVYGENVTHISRDRNHKGKQVRHKLFTGMENPTPAYTTWHGQNVAELCKNNSLPSMVKKVEFVPDPKFPIAIKEEAFKGFRNLRTVNLQGVAKLRTSCFENCRKLKFVNAPSVIAVGKKAFCECVSITKMVFPSCQEIGLMAFYGCKQIKEIRVEAKHTHISYGAFHFCRNLRKVSANEVEFFPSVNTTTNPFAGTPIAKASPIYVAAHYSLKISVPTSVCAEAHK